jgi:uncharacterized membrane protein YjgN (DUF898 family)
MNNTKNYPFVFTGTGGEYFRIWIVNIALTIITLGIYSAWAKVRTNRWFYGHTLLDNSPFSYLATPMQILKGRLIAAVLLISYIITSSVAPMIAGLIMLAIMIVSPWIIIMGLRFAARQSAYRGLKFNFTGSVGEAAIVYLLLPTVSIISLGLALPYTAYRQVRFLASNYVYGETQTTYDGTLKPFWSVYLIALGLLLLPIGIFGYAIFSAYQLAAMGMAKELIIASIGTMIIIAIISFYLIIPVLVAFIQARKANLYYNHLVLKNIRFHSTQRARDLVWIFISNLILIAITFGLFIPFAAVRVARYRSEHLVLMSDDLASFATQARESMSAVGAEISDLFDMEIGIA